MCAHNKGVAYYLWVEMVVAIVVVLVYKSYHGM
jgi:hypothetical protein